MIKKLFSKGDIVLVSSIENFKEVYIIIDVLAYRVVVNGGSLYKCYCSETRKIAYVGYGYLEKHGTKI